MTCVTPRSFFATSATRSVPLWCWGEVIDTSAPKLKAASAIRISSVATTIASALFTRPHRSQTSCRSGLPAIQVVLRRGQEQHGRRGLEAGAVRSGFGRPELGRIAQSRADLGQQRRLRVRVLRLGNFSPADAALLRDDDGAKAALFQPLQR